MSTESMPNFTPMAIQALAFSRKEAVRLRHNFVGTEHILLGLLKLGTGIAVSALTKLGLNVENVRKEIEEQISPGPDAKITGRIPYTPRVKKVLLLAAKEMRALGHHYVGTEHILLGLLREGDGLAARVLQKFGVNANATRKQILKELDPNYSPSPEEKDPPQPSKLENTSGLQNDTVDTSKRYDVYCAERKEEVVVYRNALFKGARRLFQKHGLADFLELEQADGQPVFVPLYSIIKFCETGMTPKPEPVPRKPDKK